MTRTPGIALTSADASTWSLLRGLVFRSLHGFVDHAAEAAGGLRELEDVCVVSGIDLKTSLTFSVKSVVWSMVEFGAAWTMPKTTP